MKNKRKASQGFTLVELLVVISIIGLLMALLLPAVQKVRVVGMATKTTAQLNQIAVACAQFKADTGFYPPDNAADAVKVLQAMYPRYTAAMPTLPSTPNALMVYFLQGPTGNGWAIDAPTAAASGATTRKGPWMQFQASELNGSNQVIDVWGRPLQYRASGTGGAYGPTPTNGIPAYVDGGSKAFNLGGVQVVSSGPDKKMGTGGALPNTASVGFDDLANFNSGYQLGARP